MLTTMPGTTLFPMPGCAIASAGAPAAAEGGDDCRAVFERFVELFYRRRRMRAAFESCVVARGFVDHAEGGGQRSSAMNRLAAQFGARAEAPTLCELHHVLFERDIGMVHLSVRDEPAAEARRRVEIYRVAEGRIVEHWSVGA